METETVTWSESSNQQKTIAAEQVIVTRQIKIQESKTHSGSE